MLIKTFVNRPVTTSMLFIGILIFTILTFRQISIDLLPQLDIPQFYIRTTYPDASPEEVEQLITERLEAQLSTLPNIRRISSVSREGVSVITLHFHWGTDMNIARIQTRERLDQARPFLPDQAGRPTVLHVDPATAPIMKLALTAAEHPDRFSVPVAAELGNPQWLYRDLYDLRESARAIVKRRLEQGRGVAQALITGGVEREIQVDVDLDKLRMLGIHLQEVASALERANISLPGGTIKSGHFRFALRALGEFRTLEDIRNTVVTTTPLGRAILVRDIADVRDGFKERESIARFNGNETIGILIRKEAGANTIDVSRQVRRVIGEIHEEYPEFHIEVVYDESEFIETAVSAVQQQLLWGGVLAFLILFLFLGRIHEPLVIGVSIPASIITAVLLMYIFDISINIISLGGLAVAIGMLVDNSIIVLENTARHRTRLRDLKESAITGAREVVLPITASTLTTIAVFLPLIFMEGLGGQLFRDQSLTITFSLLASLLVAVSLVPMLVSRSRQRGERIRADNNDSTNATSKKLGDKLIHYATFPTRLIYRVLYLMYTNVAMFVESNILAYTTSLVTHLRDRYERGLSWSLRHRVLVLGGTLILFSIAVYVALNMPREFMPQVPQGHFIAILDLEPGTDMSHTAILVAQIEAVLANWAAVSAVFSTIGEADEFLLTGTGGEHRGRRVELDIRLHNPTQQPMVESFIRDMASQHHGIEIEFRQPESTFERIIRPSEWDIIIAVEVEAAGSIARALEVIAVIKQSLTGIPGLLDLQPGYEMSAPEYRLVIDRERLAAYGLTVHDLVTTITQQARGITATELTEFDQKIPIVVRTSLYQPMSIDEILNTHLHFTNPSGGTPRTHPSTLPVSEFVSFYQTVGFSDVYRERQHRILHLHGAVRGRPVDRVIEDINRQIAYLPFDDVRIRIGGVQDDINEIMRQIGWVLLISVLLIYMILASQYESIVVPFVIMFSVPLALIGAVFLLAVSGSSINLVAMIGMVVLAGIAANDAIVKVDFILRRRRSGMDKDTAIIEAGKLRFRPIVMTTATLMFGLLPMAFFAGAEHQVQHPLAIAVLGGIVTSTALTLFVIPVLYSFVDRWVKI